MGLLHGVTFSTESYHYHITYLICERTASRIDRILDLAVLSGDLCFSLVVNLREVHGVVDGVRRRGFQRWEGNEVDL